MWSLPHREGSWWELNHRNAAKIEIVMIGIKVIGTELSLVPLPRSYRRIVAESRTWPNSGSTNFAFPVQDGFFDPTNQLRSGCIGSNDREARSWTSPVKMQSGYEKPSFP